jgi:hypothetical protein
VAPANQVHDFNPGIDPSGVFWTVLVPDDSVQVDGDYDKASLTVIDLRLADFFTLANSLKGSATGVFSPSPVPAVVSYALEWSRPTQQLTNAANTAPDHFTGQYVFTAATIRWSAATSTGFRFTSDPSAPTTSVFALLGQERNGVFF